MLSDWRNYYVNVDSVNMSHLFFDKLRDVFEQDSRRKDKSVGLQNLLLRDVSNVQRVWAESFPQTKWIKKNKETHVSAGFALVPLPLVLVDVCFCVLIWFAPACIQCNPDDKRWNWWSDVLVAKSNCQNQSKVKLHACTKFASNYVFAELVCARVCLIWVNVNLAFLNSKVIYLFKTNVWFQNSEKLNVAHLDMLIWTCYVNSD